MKSTQLKGKLIAIGLCATMVFGGAVTATTIANVENAQLLAAVPGVSCSGASFGTADTTDTTDISASAFLARFPAQRIVSSISNISKIYGDGNPSTENLKYGSSKDKGTFTLNLTESVTAVKMGLKAWSGDTAKIVIVNGIEYTVPSSTEYTDYVFEFPAPTSTVTFSAKNASKNRGYISYISFYY